MSVTICYRTYHHTLATFRLSVMMMLSHTFVVVKVKYDREGRLVYEKIKQEYLKGEYQSKAQLAKDNGISRQQLYRIIKLIENESK